MQLFEGLLIVAQDKCKKGAGRIISLFATMYLCELFYSTLNFMKSKHRSEL